MKKILLVSLSFFGVVSPVVINAQTFTSAADTIWANVGSTSTMHNDLTNTTTSALNLSWQVKNSNFPADWLTPSSIGICDACTCISNTSNMLWNASTSTGNSYNCTYVDIPRKLTPLFHAKLTHHS